jgi:hypothetical protein
VVATNRTGPVTEPVLPSSRQPVPGSEAYERPAPQRADGRREGERQRRTAAQIESEIDETTERLAANVDELVARLRPANIARRGLAGTRGLVTDPAGRPRAEVVGAVVGALVGVAVLTWWARRR